MDHWRINLKDSGSKIFVQSNFFIILVWIVWAALSDEQMMRDCHFPYEMTSKWATRWGLSTNQLLFVDIAPIVLGWWTLGLQFFLLPAVWWIILKSLPEQGAPIDSLYDPYTFSALVLSLKKNAKVVRWEIFTFENQQRSWGYKEL